MKKTTMIIVVICIMLLSGCGADISVEKLTLEDKQISVRVREYSYVREDGEITGSIDMEVGKTVAFISKGRPVDIDDDEYPIYLDDGWLFVAVNMDGGMEYIETFAGDCCVFRLLQDDEKITKQESKGFVEVKDLFSDDEVDTIAWFKSSFMHKGHRFGLSYSNSLYRETFYGNENTILDKGPCANLQYDNGSLYYTKDKKLYRMDVEGTNKVLLCNKRVSDYVVNETGVVIMSQYEDKIVIYTQEFDAKQTAEMQSYAIDTDHSYSLIGVNNDTVYLSKGADSADKFELVAMHGGKMHTLNTLGEKCYQTSDTYQPIMIEGCIYYLGTKDEMHGIIRYNISRGNSDCIAESMFCLELYVD